jgi:hypothetical protein
MGLVFYWPSLFGLFWAEQNASEAKLFGID